MIGRAEVIAWWWLIPFGFLAAVVGGAIGYLAAFVSDGTRNDRWT